MVLEALIRSCRAFPWAFAALLLAGLLACALPRGAHASEPLTVGAEPVSLAGHLEALEDPQGELTFEEVAFGEAAARFAPIPGNYNGGQARPGAAWIRFSVRSGAGAGIAQRILDMGLPNLDEIRVFVGSDPTPRTAADFIRYTVGTQHPYAARPIPYPRFLIPLDIGPEPVPVFLRVQTRFARVLSGRVASSTDILRADLPHWLFVGGYMCVCLLIAGINFTFWFWLRDRFYLFYSVYSLSLIPSAIWVYGLLSLLFPDHGGVLSLPVRGLVVGVGISAGFAFLADFLPFRQTSRLAYRATLGIVALGPLYILAALANQWHLTLYPTVAGLILGLPLLWETIRLAFKGDSRARIYLLSFMPANVAILAVVARDLQLLPGSPLIHNGFQISSMAHLVIMTIGLGYRIREAERGRQKAKRQALRVARSANRRANEMVEQRTRELATAKTRLEKALDGERNLSRQQLQFIDTISHEYRTPVAVLRTNLDLLAMAARKRIAVPETALSRMRAAIARLTEIIEISLSASRINANALMPNRRQVYLHRIVEDAVGAAEGLHPERRIDYAASNAATKLCVNADAAMLKTVVVNLLDNALKYSPAGTSISVELARQGDMASLKVADNGKGIPQKDLPYVFEKYFRARGSSERPGAGLGLHLVQGIVSAHGGKIALASSSTGTTVTVMLPLQVVSARRGARNRAPKGS